MRGLNCGLGLQRNSVGAYSYSDAAVALFARMTSTPSSARKCVIDGLVRAIQASGAWSKLDYWHAEAAHHTQAAKLNWIADQYNLTEYNSPAFTVDRGYKGDGVSSYLATGFSPYSGAGTLTRNDAAYGLFVVEEQTLNAYEYGSTGTPGSYMRMRTRASGTSYFSCNDTTASSQTGNAYPAYFVITRSTSGSFDLYRNGVYVTTYSVASVSVPAELLILRNSASYANSRIGLTHAGRALSAGEIMALYNGIHSYMMALGVV